MAGAAPTASTATPSNGMKSFFMTHLPLLVCCSCKNGAAVEKLPGRLHRSYVSRVVTLPHDARDARRDHRLPVAALAESSPHIGARDFLLGALVEDHDLVAGLAQP